MPTLEEDARADAKEGKYDDEGKGGAGDKEAAHVPRVDVTRIEVDPDEQSPVEEGLSLDIDFTLDRELRGAFWEVKLVVDSMRTRQVLELGQTAQEDYAQGSSSMHFSVERVDVSGVTPGVLANCGLLVASLKCDKDDISSVVVDVNLVVMVGEVDGRLMRRVYNPLE